MTQQSTGARRRPRRVIVLGVALLAVLGLATTCVVVAQTGDFDDDRIGGSEPTAPSRASMSDNGAATPEDSGPPATPWQQVRWRDAAKKNQIIGITLPPKPPAEQARKDPLRVSLVLLATLDSTNPDEWKPGVNPLRGYMSASLDKAYTPPKRDAAGDDEDPGDGAAKLPAGAEAEYEFYCHVASHSKKRVVSQCGFHVRTTSDRKVLRDERGVVQRVTATRAEDGWRVNRMVPVTGPGGD